MSVPALSAPPHPSATSRDNRETDGDDPGTPLVSWSAVRALAGRELVRFFRQRSRLIGAVAQPVLFWILFGAGLHGSFTPPDWAPAGLSYQRYFFPGVAVMIVLFTISVIEDRREGFLQGVLVAPVSRLSIVLGKVLGGAAIAWLQAGLFLALAPTQGMPLSFPGIVWVLLFLALLSIGLTSLGFLLAWRLDSTQGFHAIMSVFLFPMWLLSGAFFPPAESGWLAWIMRLNPLTYGVAGLRRLLYLPETLPVTAGLPAWGVCLAVTLAFTVVCVVLAAWQARQRTAADAR